MQEKKIIVARLELGPFYVSHDGTGDDIFDNEPAMLDLATLQAAIDNSKDDVTRQMVVGFDDMEDMAMYYETKLAEYDKIDTTRVVGKVVEINLEAGYANIEIDPNALFKLPLEFDYGYILYIRGNSTWQDNKIMMSTIYAYDIVPNVSPDERRKEHE